VTERKRSEAALIQVIQEVYIQGVSTRKIEKLARRLGIENLSRSQVSEMTQGLNEQAEDFRNRSLVGEQYPVIWVDALYEKVRYAGRVVSIAVLLVCGVNESGRRQTKPQPYSKQKSYASVMRSNIPRQSRPWRQDWRTV